MNIIEQFNAVLRLLEREDRLTNSRMTWYLTIQGFIIAAIALTFTGKFEFDEQLRTPAIIALSALGIEISIVVFISVRRARSAKRDIGRQWNTWLSNAAPNVAASCPSPMGNSSWWAHVTPGQSVPCILVVFWLVVIGAAI